MRNSIIFLILTSVLAFSACTAKKEETPVTKKTPVVICFDVEDYTSPESVGMDDIPKWLAEIMTEEGVTGTFFVIGEKARMMEKRGRKDVLEAMAKHDIGSHTNFGSIHPTVTEILENASWEEGNETMLENETAGFDELEQIFGQRPVNLARHGGSYGPQLIGALSQLNAGYAYSFIHLPGHNMVWFCNALNFHGEGDYGSFDNVYYRDDLFDPFQDKRSAYIFIVNLKGARSEGFATGENYTLGWDGLWKAKCQIDREVLPADFEVAEGVVIPKDDYRYVNYHIGTSTASFRKFQCYLDYSFGGFYSGNYNNIQTGVNLQLDGYVKLQVGANMVRGHLPGFI